MNAKKKNRSKIKVKKWLDTPDLKKYEAYILDWHNFLIDVQEVFYQSEDETLIKNLNMYVFNPLPDSLSGGGRLLFPVLSADGRSKKTFKSWRVSLRKAVEKVLTLKFPLCII